MAPRYAPAALGLAVAAGVSLAVGRVDPGLVADLAGAGTAALFALAWFALPWALGRHGSPARSGRPAKVDRGMDG